MYFVIRDNQDHAELKFLIKKNFRLDTIVYWKLTVVM